MSYASDVFDVKVDFPFDLNNLFNLSYSFEELKQAIEFLAKNQAAHAKMLSHLNNGGDPLSNNYGGYAK